MFEYICEKTLLHDSHVQKKYALANKHHESLSFLLSYSTCTDMYSVNNKNLSHFQSGLNTREYIKKMAPLPKVYKILTPVKIELANKYHETLSFLFSYSPCTDTYTFNNKNLFPFQS